MTVTVKLRIIVGVVVLPVLLLGAFGFALYTSTFNQVYDEEKQGLLALADLVAEELYIPIAQKYQILQSLRTDRQFKEAIELLPLNTVDYEAMRNAVPDYEDLRNRLIDITTGTPIDLLYVASEDAQILFSDREPELPASYVPRERPWYTGAVERYREFQRSGASAEDIIGGGNTVTGSRESLFFFTPPYPTAEEGAEQSYAVTASAVILQGNQVRGVAALDYDIAELSQVAANLAREHEILIALYDPQSMSQIFSLQSGFLDPSDDANALRNVALNLGYDPEKVDTLVQEIQNIGEVYFEGNSAQLGLSMLQTTEMRGAPIGIMVGQSLDEVVAGVRSRVFPPIFIGILIAIIVQMAGVFYIGRSVFRPLNQLTLAIQELSQGSGDLTSSIDVYRRDEFGTISSGFNEFVLKLHDIVVNIKTAAEVVTREKEDLLSNTEESASAATQITANVDSVKSQIANLDEQIQSVSSAMEEIQATAVSLNSNTDTQKLAVDQATASIEQMVASLRSVAGIVQAKQNAATELQSVIEDAGSKVNDAAEAYNEVVQLADRISEMSEVIQNIASQTNLLSMNAAIEAAHAGESGRGFAVVAEEIRKLAEVAQTNSTQITDVVNEITRKVDVAASVATNSSKAFQQVRDETQSTIQALNEINSSTQELSEGGEQIIQANSALNEVSTSVQQSAKEMESTVAMVTKSTNEIADISRSVNSAMSEIATGVNEVSLSSDHIREISYRLSDSSKALNAETEKFITKQSANVPEPDAGADPEVEAVPAADVEPEHDGGQAS
ncbi:methyl-accepting chemotaxis protein [Salinispira pacifica]|uniref:Methyl-accepting chemotaxis protein n=1 Tax=Salinispira pacifica TaxID=1307761 RepID=V5WK89_9SPIO|nr:methyl-accepting chemotaxis protein [Salinispira pacifica]AHC16040.1 methyl-accepting chemotaxis protein [Salinispira pacifica]